MSYTKGEEWTIRVQNFEKAKEKIENGEPFRIANEDWIYKVESNASLPIGVYCIRRMHKQSVNSMFKFYCKFEEVDDPQKRILIGKDHEDVILKEVFNWSKDVNEKGKAYSGCDFKAYLRAIPISILSSGDFLEKAVEEIDRGFHSKHVRGKVLTEKFEKMNDDAVSLICSRVEENPEKIRNAPKQITFFDIIDKCK